MDPKYFADITNRLTRYQKINAPLHLYRRFHTLLIPALISENGGRVQSRIFTVGFGIAVFTVIIIGVVKIVSPTIQPHEATVSENAGEQVTQKPEQQKENTAAVTKGYSKLTTTPTPTMVPGSFPIQQGETKGIQSSGPSSGTVPTSTHTPQLTGWPTPQNPQPTSAPVGEIYTAEGPSQRTPPDVSIDIPPQK